MVLSLVGFLAAYRDPLCLDPMLAGSLCGALTTWVTFMPFLPLDLSWCPCIERLRSSTALSGALSAITAALVGVILNLAIWFGLHVLFGRVGTFEAGSLSIASPDLASINWIAVALSVLAVVCLFRLKLGILRTLGVCGALGLVAAAAAHFSLHRTAASGIVAP